MFAVEAFSMKYTSSACGRCRYRANPWLLFAVSSKTLELSKPLLPMCPCYNLALWN